MAEKLEVINADSDKCVGRGKCGGKYATNGCVGDAVNCHPEFISGSWGKCINEDFVNADDSEMLKQVQHDSKNGGVFTPPNLFINWIMKNIFSATRQNLCRDEPHLLPFRELCRE